MYLPNNIGTIQPAEELKETQAVPNINTLMAFCKFWNSKVTWQIQITLLL